MRLRFSYLAVVLLIAASASAQGGLTASPDPYDNDAGIPLVLRNGTSASVTLDSLRVASTVTINPYRGSVVLGYRLHVGGSVSEGGVSCRPPPYHPYGCYGSDLFGQTLGPQDFLEITGFARYCEICRGSPGGSSPDTLRVYSGGDAKPLNVKILNVVFVASEAPPEASALRLGVSPNPSRGASVVHVSYAASGPVRVAAYDALGREVAVLHDGPAAEALDLRVDTSAWAPGVYVVRASAGGEALSRRLVVVR